MQLCSECSPGSVGAGFESGSRCDSCACSSEKISCSIDSSWESGSLNPSPEKILMPLSVHGLCEAEITTPASNFRERARYATPGVVITPALCTSTLREARPRATRSAIQRLDSRVSWPIRTRGWGLVRPRSWPRARPMRNVLSGVRGNSPATPRMPSVPKSCRAGEVISETSRFVVGRTRASAPTQTHSY